MKKQYTLAALSVALLTMPAVGFAADAPDDKWHFGVTVPLWAPGIDGDVTLRGKGSDVNIDYDDLKENLDAAFGLGIEARKNKFGLFSSVGYMKFEGDEKKNGVKADWELKLLILDAGASYQLIRTEGERPFILEAYAGMRYWSTETDLKVKDNGTTIVNGDNSNDLIDPIVGLRGSQYLTPKLHLDFQGDIGGFGISDNQSDFEWSASGMVSYDVVKWCTLSAGYRALAIDKSEGSGSHENGLNIVMHGLALAAKFKF